MCIYICARAHNIYHNHGSVCPKHQCLIGKLIACFQGLDMQNLLMLLGSPWIRVHGGGGGGTLNMRNMSA